MRTFPPFDPLARINLAASAAEALLERDPEALGTLEPFIGAGSMRSIMSETMNPTKS